MFIVWAKFWDRDYNEAEWVYDDVLARGRGHSIYAVHKQGKSLFMLYIAAQLATGAAPVAVVYLDYEMTEADVHDRLEDMGYGVARIFRGFATLCCPASHRSTPPRAPVRCANCLIRCSWNGPSIT